MRLIDADELIKELKSLSIVLNGKQIFFDDAKNTVLRVIDEQPTGYDIGKVVEELEKAKYGDCEHMTCEYSDECCYVDGLNRAIEIVKQGGVGKDVE